MSDYQEHLNRMLAAVHLENTDRTPFMSSGSAVNAALTGLPLSTYCADMKANCQANLLGIQKYSDPDGVQVTIFQPDVLATCWLGKMEIPGRELSENELWQMHEKEIVKQSDYDEILENGFAPWYQEMLTERLGNPLQYCQEFFEFMGPSIGIFAEAGYPCFCGGDFYSPFEMFCGGRSLYHFFSEDLIDIPEKVEKVFRLTQKFNMDTWENTLKNPKTRPLAVWIGGWRGTPDLLSPEMFQRFSWKYMREIIDMILSYDVIPLLHLDSDWSLGLSYFKELPKGRCILAFDGKTDIFKAKEVVGDHCCIMGDVPASLLSFGSAEDVDAYCKKLIKEVGKNSGYIMSSGCDAPYNSKEENLKIMADSVLKYR